MPNGIRCYIIQYLPVVSKTFCEKRKKDMGFLPKSRKQRTSRTSCPRKKKEKAPPLLNSKTGAALVRTTVKAAYFKKRINSIAALVSPSTFSLPVVKANTGSSLPFTNFIKLVPLMISRALRSW